MKNLPVLLHIGFHKTGTTYLQDHVFDPGDRGFVSPWVVQGGQAIHHFVLSHPMKYSPRDAASAFFEAADALFPDNPRLPVISHEDLCGQPISGRYYGHDVAARLQQAFPNAKVPIGVGEQRSMLRSPWGHYIKEDREWSIEQFFGTGSERVGFGSICRFDDYEYDILVRRYLELFGRDRALVLPFELLGLGPSAYEQAVHDFCNTGLRVSVSHPASNVGYGALTLRLRRHMNRFAKIRPLWEAYEDLPLSCRAKQRSCRVLQRVIPQSWHEPEERRLREFIDQRVGDHFRASNRRLAELTKIDLARYGYDV